jgi:hypothetical protein
MVDALAEERCNSPLNPNCGSRDITVYIVFHGAKLPICRRCWGQIADSDLEWGEEKVSAKTRRRKVEEAKGRFLEKIMKEAMAEVADRTVQETKKGNTQ